MKPTQPVVPSENVGKLLAGMAKTGFQGRRLGESVDIWAGMIRDPDCTILLGLSGAMIPAGMQRVLMELAGRNFFDVLVSTGANIFHDTCEHLGVRHYQGHDHTDDEDLFSRGIDRIHDIWAYEKEFRAVDRRIANFAKGIAPFRGSSREFVERLGRQLRRDAPDSRSLVTTCVEKGIPVFIPALADSSIGIGLVMARREGAAVEVDQIADVDEITAMVEGSKRTGVVYVGGGVPKNFIQQTQVVASIHGQELGGHAYAVQYTTDAPHWGGLSGCTFEEAVSWGKESPTSSKVQVFCDATIALPLVTSALIARGEKRAKRT
ncbi:MAG TPA: deoxyhypusine synthase [Methanomicrobiales archaeon]|nr:deoxyhypusine synthase [Methanomicrobiales archaeon]